MADRRSDLVGAVGGRLCGGPHMGMSDIKRERLIAAYRTIVEIETHRERNRMAMLRLCELIAQRPAVART